MATLSLSNVVQEGFQVNRSPATFDPQRDLPQGFLEFLAPSIGALPRSSAR